MTRTADEKYTKTGQNDKTKGRRWNMYRQKKINAREDNKTTWGNKPEITGERRKFKNISTKGKTIQTKQDIARELKEILPISRWRWHEKIPTNGCKRNRQFRTKIWQPIEHTYPNGWPKKSTFIQKYPFKGNTSNNYIPITCLPMM